MGELSIKSMKIHEELDSFYISLRSKYYFASPLIS